MKFVFIADFFAHQVLGGGELNNEELINILQSQNHVVEKINSHEVNVEFIKRNKNKNFIIANFVNLKTPVIAELIDNNYVIYEHDHKYMANRDPSVYPDFKAPPEALVNLGFYKNAKAVMCQSSFHAEIIAKNTQLNNLVNLSGNLWSQESLSIMEKMSQVPKEDTCAIMRSSIIHKNTKDAIAYCEYKKKQYNLIESSNYEEFLSQLGQNKTFVFFPKTPETLSRVVVEARMMGMSVIVNRMIGATREPWYKLKGDSLIREVRNMRKTIPSKVVEAFA